MSDIVGSVKLTGFISPSDTLDTFPTHKSLYGLGGLKVVDKLINAINLIPLARRLIGLLLYVTLEDKYYKYIGNDEWLLLIADVGDVDGGTF